MSPQSSNHSLTKRLGIVVSVGSALSVGLLALGGGAHALDVGDGPPDPPIDNIDDLLLEEDDPLDVPVLTLPEGSDGPILTIPGGNDGGLFDDPILTIPIVPDDTTPPDETTPPYDTTPPEGEDPVGSPEGEGTTQTETPTGPSNVAPYVVITSATVDCAGMVHVTYETGAAPALAPENDHVVMFSPASNPAAVTSQRLFHRPVNGTFTVDLQSPAAEGYRVFVVADFEPANLEGVVLVDEFDASAPVDCPVATPAD